MQTWLTEQTPFLIFAAFCVAAFGLQFWWLRKVKFARSSWLVWILAALLLGLGWQMSEEAGRREWKRVQSLTQDFAQLYGDEIEARGHWKLASNVATNDPLYLTLIATEIKWEKLNPDVSDIYTLRKTPGGTNIFIVDSETDYNRNGRYDGEREQRTPVGEVYDVVDDGLERAFHGQPNFDFVPVTDRWGTWVSAYVPLHDPAGRVEGVMGVDFEAREFARAITNAKLRILSLMALLELMLLGSSTLNHLLRAQIAGRRQHQAEREKLIVELQTALNQVNTLSGLLPICASCKKIRDDQGYWNQIETYVTKHSAASFSHGFCPECAVKNLESAGVPVSEELRDAAKKTK